MNKLIYNPAATIDEAIRLLDQNGNGFLPVVDEENHLVGIVTDGDIRRAFLRRAFSLEEIINRKPTVMDYRTPRRQVIQHLKNIKRRHMPLVDEANRLHTVIGLDEIGFNAKPNKVLIMAGGMGTRLGSLTAEVPKPMLPLGDKPILQYIIDNFYDAGFSDLYISVNYKADVIKNYFGNGNQLGVSISYLEEREQLGTAGALSLIPDKINEPVIVINGDILTTVNMESLLDYHVQEKNSGTMCVKEMDFEFPYGAVRSEHKRITTIEEKPKVRFQVNTGIYVLSPEAVEEVPKGKFFNMPDLFNRLLEKKMQAGIFHLSEYWLDIGQVKDYETARSFFKI